ncbi:MAG: WbqC family protein [Rhodocyclaceae bacterium]|nr:WbqC family protein [Rhodocyclaceae bacterium]
MSTLVILQPGYLPWLGFFDQMLRSDVFVYYDDVQYDKHGWRNRNRIKSPAGPTWLTVPVLNSGRLGQPIIDVVIDNRQPWARKHVTTIAHNYAAAPYLKRYLPQLEEILHRPWERLAELDIAVVELMCEWMGIRRTVRRASQLNVGGERSQRLLDICRHFGADTYLTGDSARNYLDLDLFAAGGLRVEWQSYVHPVYRQLHGEFAPYLSALDLVLNMGPESLNILEGKM